MDRAQVVDKNFRNAVLEGKFPEARVSLTLKDVSLSPEELVDLFESQVMSRHLDLQARRLRAQNEGFYTIGSSGHEGNAVFGKVFRLQDMGFLHYRSGALFIQRSKQYARSTVLYDMILSLAASAEDPISGGRHKVFGSRELFFPPQTSTIASHLPKSVGAALSIHRAKDLEIEGAVLPSDSVILCGFGDASASHSTAVGAFNMAEWVSFKNRVPLPIVFICEDNGIGISVRTPENWIERAYGSRPVLKYFKCDGLHLLDAFRCAEQAVHYTRTVKMPVFVHMKTVRLLGHAGSDVETTYRSLTEIQETEFQDPLLHSARILLENQVLTQESILDLYETTRDRIERIAQEAIKRPRLKSASEVMASILPPKLPKKGPPSTSSVGEEKRKAVFGREYEAMKQPQHLARMINWALIDLLMEYPQLVVFGEDVAQKGGVYHVTAGLMERFGMKRVFDSILDEQSILGVAMGMAHNGFVPIPEIQFLAYLHNAEDQIRGEASTLSFFSKGQYTNPMVVRVAGLAYQKGFGGHFHNDNSLAVLRDIPGIIVAVPSNGLDAVRMLRACVRAAVEEQRVVVFIEPIALYMTRDLHEPQDQAWAFSYPSPEEAPLKIGEFGVWKSAPSAGKELCIVTYGNGTYLSRQAAQILQKKHSVELKIIDLRWIAPLDQEGLIKEIQPASHVLIVEECRKTGSLSEALVTLIVEHGKSLPQIKRIAAEDCFIPLGNASTLVLPSRDGIVSAALELLGKK